MKETLEDLRQEVKLLEDLYHTLQFSDKFKEPALKIEIILADIQRVNKRIEEILQTVKESMEPSPLDLIGKKIKGFRFTAYKYNNIYYSDYSMGRCVGVIGTIVSYDSKYNSYRVLFKDHFEASWAYPAELITEHLID